MPCKYNYYKKIKRTEKRFCEACGKQLRENYKKNDRVCSHPKIDKKTQSKCQVWKQQKDRGVRIRRCAVCNTELKFASANQKYCKRPPHIRRLCVDPRTKCEVIGQRVAEQNWRNRNKNGRVPDKMFLGHANQNVAKKVEVRHKKRLCLGVLTNEEKGKHYFMSISPFNRICPDCQNALNGRRTSTYKFATQSAHREE